MNVIESLRIAFQALVTNKLRAVLTMLGIIIGVGAVIGMLALGNGFQGFLTSQFEQLGIGTAYVLPFVDSNELDTMLSAKLTASDARAIMQPGQAPDVLAVAYEFSGDAQVMALGQRSNYSVRAVNPDFFLVTPQDLAVGRYFTEADEQNRARVAILGKNVANELFGGPGMAINQRLTLNGVGFDVIAVMSADAGQLSAGSDPADSILIPYETGISRLFRNNTSPQIDVSQIAIKAIDRNRVDQAIEQVTAILRAEHRLTYQESDFTIINLDQFAQQANIVIGAFNAFLGSIAGISLLVGGIGIMNIMLVSVTERTREIGLRKAVGARQHDILLQFLIEALVLCLLGSTIGILLGYLLSLIGTFFLVNVFGAAGAEATVTSANVILASGIAAGIGIAFGFFPALTAARLNPIEALRTE